MVGHLDLAHSIFIPNNTKLEQKEDNIIGYVDETLILDQKGSTLVQSIYTVYQLPIKVFILSLWYKVYLVPVNGQHLHLFIKIRV
jgi:hypothetical protein